MLNQEALDRAQAIDYDRPGKFEGESLAAGYYWHCMLEGDGEPRLNADTVFDVSAEEREAFDLEPGTKYVVLTESEQGFVGLVEVPTAEELDRVTGSAVLCGCGWGLVWCPYSRLPEECPQCGYIFAE